MQEMRNVEIDWLGSVDGLAEASEELALDHLIVKLRDPLDAGPDPKRKDEERADPRPPAAPRAHFFGRATMAPLERHDARQQKRVDDRSLDEHRGGQQCEGDHPIASTPGFSEVDFLPDLRAEQKDGQRER